MNRKITSLSEDEKAAALKVIGQQISKLEREHGEAVVRWAVNRRHEQRVERTRLKKEKQELETRLAELSSV